jgi:hypothetical protein
MTHTANVHCTCHTESKVVHQDEDKSYWMHQDGTPARIYHIHREWQSRDCDGLYSGTQIFKPGEKDYYAFWEETVKEGISAYSTGTLEIKVHGSEMHAEWSEPTEEGFSRWELRMCRDPYCGSDESTYRNHTAEAAGY